MRDSGNVQARRRIVASMMNRCRGRRSDDPVTKMIKLALIALFAMSMATLTIAASALPVDTATVATASLG